MLSLLIAIRVFVRALRIALRESEFRSLALIASSMLGIGTVFYHSVEGWGWLDSLYFCVITLATVGYGDFTPQTDLGKIFTMIYLVLGIGLLVAVLTKLSQALVIARTQKQ